MVIAGTLALLLVALGGGHAAVAGKRDKPTDQTAAKGNDRGTHHGHGGHHRGRHRAGYRTTTVRWGPFTVPGAANGPGMLENTIVRDGGCRSGLGCLDVAVEKPCEDCFLTRIVPNLVDARSGETLNFHNGGMLHHVVNLNWSRSDVTCPAGRGPGLINWLGQLEGGNDRFFASGNERTIMRLPRGYGLPVRAEDEWGLIFHLMNMTPEARDVAIEYTFTWTRRHLKPVTPIWLDIDNCGDSELDVPTGYSDTQWDWKSTITGKVVAIGGHVHDNGISVAAENVTRTRAICTSTAGYARGSAFTPAGPGSGSDRLHPKWWQPMSRSDHPHVALDTYNGHIAGMTGCRRSAGRISLGDTIRLHAQYNVRAPALGEGVMGIMVGYVHERG
jgi:hypothetical protein